MIDQLVSLLTPQVVVTLLAAIAAFATALTVLMPVLASSVSGELRLSKPA